MKTYTGKFIKLANQWRVIVNTGTPMVGDEIRVRKADKSVVTLFVSALAGKYEGKAVCETVQCYTESAPIVHRIAGEIRPAEMLASLRPSATLARRSENRERRSSYEVRYQIGL